MSLAKSCSTLRVKARDAFRTILAIVLTIVTGAAAVRATPVTGQTPAGSARPERVVRLAHIRDAGLFLQQILDAHNAARAAVGVPPLQWDTHLAADAQAWATHLAETHTFVHSTVAAGGTDEGENLWKGSVGWYSYPEMMDGWTDERRFFRNDPTPNFSTTGRWEDVGHYTQVVWRTTTRVGCGLASNSSEDVLVCRYTDPGNYDGERAI